MTAKEFFDTESDRQYKASPGFHASFDSIARIPFVVLPAVYKVMQSYADQQTDHLQEQVKAHRELLTEILASWRDLNELTPELEERIESLIKTASNPEKE